MLTVTDLVESLNYGNYTVSLHLDDLTPQMRDVAKKELRETSDNRENGIRELRKLLRKETDLHCPLENDDWLVMFLRPTKFYPESALKLIKNYYNYKLKYSDLFKDLLPSNETNVFRQNVITVLPYRDQFGRRIVIIHYGKKWNYKKCSLTEIMKAVFLLVEISIQEPLTQVAGNIFIFDMDGMTLQHTWQFTPLYAKQMLDWLQDCVPTRVKNLHIVNQPYVFKVVFALFKPILREKLKSRVEFHGNDMNSLHRFISPECLPPVYGGSNEETIPSMDAYLQLLLANEKLFKAVNSYGYKKK